MSVGAEVDALALMLDGACNADGSRTSAVWVKDLVRGGELCWLAIHRDYGDYGEVAEAILELEAWADWWQYETEDDAPFRLSPLAHAAHRHASGYASDQILLEAAAILRDGWRPSGWKAGSQ